MDAASVPGTVTVALNHPPLLPRRVVARFAKRPGQPTILVSLNLHLAIGVYCTHGEQLGEGHGTLSGSLMSVSSSIPIGAPKARGQCVLLFSRPCWGGFEWQDLRLMVEETSRQTFVVPRARDLQSDE